jgi:hypothetical protein
MEQFEYRVCQAQQSRVTFADGEWAGQVPATDHDIQKALNSCPKVWQYLNQAGAEGWKLVAVTTRVQEEGQIVDVLYLRRRY